MWLVVALVGGLGAAAAFPDAVVGDGTQPRPCAKAKAPGDICDPIQAKVCQAGSCASVCALRGLSPCTCPGQADRECYRCCGSAREGCRPAHLYSIFKPNGERWEKASCSVCVDMDDGLQCDDKDPTKLCKNGRCTSDLCRGLNEGDICDKSKTKICVDNKCIEPCGNGRLLCECDTAYRSLELSGDRCQLCCFDFSAKECRSAHKHYGVTTAAGRPVARTGLSCGRNKACDRYGICAKAAASQRRAGLLLLLILASLGWMGR